MVKKHARLQRVVSLSLCITLSLCNPSRYALVLIYSWLVEVLVCYR